MTGRWTPQQARDWAASQPWICGFNFLPSTAVNFLEMWQADSFDRETIARELAWGAAIGFNSIRINPHVLVWQHDRAGLIERFDWVLSVAAELGLGVVPCFFDDCGFGGEEPRLGPQPDPVPGVHNSRAVACPGRIALTDRGNWPVYEAYVRDLTRRYRDDPRILFWDIYNEPGNRMVFDAAGARLQEPDMTPDSIALMTAAFGWCRAENPVQPLTTGAWATPVPGSGDPPYQTEADLAALDLSDIVTFHAYWDTPHVAEFIDHLRALDRPMVCTEWMARPVGSLMQEQLPLFREAGVGCMQWGLVRGRIQTELPWPQNLVALHGGTADRGVWFQDLLQQDGRPYDPDETETLKRVLSAGA